MSEHVPSNPIDAATALARAQELDSAVRSGSRWFVRYQVLYGIAAAVTVATLGLLSYPVGVAIATTFWLVTIAALSVYAIRQPVSRHGLGRRHQLMILVWTLLYIAVLFPGTRWFSGEPAWWLPGAVVVALPGLVGAYLAARR